MAKKKKENGKEEIPDVSPDLSVSDSVINRSQIYQDNSIHNTTNVYFPQESKKETKYGCPECDKTFDSKHSWKQHFNAKHREAEPEIREPQFPNCLKCGDAKDVDLYEDGLACYYCEHVINENGECISGSYCSKCNSEDFLEEPEDPEEPEEIGLLRLLMRDYEGEPRVAKRVVTHHIFAGPLFAIIYIFFSGEIYNLLSAQMYEWTYWAGTTLPFFIFFGTIYTLGFIGGESYPEERLMHSLLLVSVGPFIIALISIMGNKYGMFWSLFFTLIIVIFYSALLPSYDRFNFLMEGTLLAIILFVVAQFFVLFEDTFRGVGTFYVTTLDGFLPSVIKYELVYALFSIGLVFVVISPSFYFAETSSEHDHYLSHGIVLGLLFFLIEFFVYPISDSVAVAILLTMFLTFISFQSTKRFFNYDYYLYK